MPVLRDGRLAGLLIVEKVGELVMIQSALRNQKPVNVDPKFEA